MKHRFVLMAGALACLAAATPAAAQQQAPQWRQAVSANPFGLLVELFNAEYERIITESATAGIGGSTISDDDDRYINADVFARYYPSGRPLDGWAFGAKAGLTRIPESGTYFGYGFDANRSWLLGRNNNFYVGIGFGLKRLIGTPENDPNTFEDESTWRFVPTLRLVNIGFAF